MGFKDYIFKKSAWFTINCVEIEGMCHIVYPKGHFDATSAGHAEKTIIEIVEKADSLIFNLNELQYVSSAGLRVFLVVAKKMKAKNSPLHFCCLNQNVKQVFEISNFHTILEIHDSEKDALDKIKLKTKCKNADNGGDALK
jgi:anti-anti-sigma factor